MNVQYYWKNRARALAYAFLGRSLAQKKGPSRSQGNFSHECSQQQYAWQANPASYLSANPAAFRSKSAPKSAQFQLIHFLKPPQLATSGLIFKLSLNRATKR
jgi:hypothetical protein